MGSTGKNHKWFINLDRAIKIWMKLQFRLGIKTVMPKIYPIAIKQNTKIQIPVLRTDHQSIGRINQLVQTCIQRMWKIKKVGIMKMRSRELMVVWGISEMKN